MAYESVKEHGAADGPVGQHGDDSSGDAPFMLYPQRWWQMLWYSCGPIASGMLWVSLIPISVFTQQYYSVSNTAVNTVSTLFLALYVPSAMVASWVFPTKGVRYSLVLGNLCNILGALLRALAVSPSGFPWLVAGQLVASFGQGFLFGGPAQFSAQWFGQHEQNTATAISSLANTAGIAFGFIAGPLIVSHSSHIPAFMLVCSAVTIALAIPPLLWLRERPPTPANAASVVGTSNFSSSIRTLWRSRQWVLLTISFSTVMVVFNVFSTLLSDILTPYHYSAPQIGSLGVLLTVGGAVLSGLIGWFADRFRNLERIWHCILAGVAASLAVLAVVIPHASFPVVLLVAFALGACALSTIPIGFQLCVEVSFPVPESVSVSVMFLIPQGLAVPSVYAVAALPSPLAQLWSLVAITALAWILTLALMRVTYQRRAFEHARDSGTSPGIAVERAKLLPGDPDTMD